MILIGYYVRRRLSRYEEVEDCYFLVPSGFSLPGASSSYPANQKSLMLRPLQNLAQ